MSLEIEKHSNLAKKVDNLYSLFDASVTQYREKSCLVRLKNTENSRTTSKTYEEVNHEVHRLSDSIHFPQYRFIGIVGTQLSVEIVVCILGILKSDAAFVFLNATDSEIAASSVEKLRIQHLIGKKNVVREFLKRRWVTTFELAKTAIIFGEEFGLWYRTVEVNDVSSNLESKFAFAVLSSGSTKLVPKVIKVPHRSILPNIVHLKQIYRLEAADTVLVSTPLTFDPCVHDIFLAFYSGCCVLIADAVQIRSNELTRALFDPNGYNATVFFTTPSTFRQWRPQAGPCSLRILILGGEPFPPMAALHDAFSRGIQIYNIYGVTEVSCWASVFRVPPNFQGAVPLGSVLSETVFEVRGEDGQVIDVGIGELFIGSTTRICVIDDDSELNDGSRPCFRSSGDLVEIINGMYYFVGRKDRRVKLFGHQVDPTLIENRILMHPSVDNCLVFTNDVEIIALIESSETVAEELTVETLKTFLSVDLPSHMMPNDFRFVTQLPLGSHGKISLKRGKALYEQMIHQEDVRSKFGRLWIEYTNRTCLDEECGFLDSGGSSFAAVQLNAALERITNVPKNFIELLVLNKNFLQCLRLISEQKSDIISSKVFGSCDQRNSESGVDIFDVTPVEFDKFIGALCKGRCLHYGSTLSVSDKVIQVEWRYDLKKCVDSSPTLLVFENRAVAVCGSHSGYVIVVEIESGKIILKIKLPHRIESSACPDMDGRRFFIGCYDGNMYAVDIISGSIVWKYSTDDIIKSTAVLFDKKLFFGSYDHYFHCISSADGALVWKVNVDNSAIYTTAIVRSDVIISATLAGTVAFIDHNGEIKKLVTDSKPIFSNPVEIPSENVVVVVDVNCSMRCFDLNLFSELWRDEVPGHVFSSLSLMGGSDSVKIIFASQSGTVYCFEVSRIVPRNLWERKLEGQAYATPFCCETWNAVIAVTTDGDLYILDADSGNIFTSYSIKAPVFSSPVAYGNNIVVGSRDNYLYCFTVGNCDQFGTEK